MSTTTGEDALTEAVRRYAATNIAPTAIERDEQERFDRSIFEGLADIGLLGALLPASVGGAELPWGTWIGAMELLGAADMATAVTVSVHVLSALPVATWGTPEQMGSWLPAMVRGENLGAFAITEPGTGSDAAAIVTRARRIGDPDDPEAYSLNGMKTWITNAPAADQYLVFATVDPELGPRGVTAFLVEKGVPRFRFGSRMLKMGVRSTPASELLFEDCVVPATRRLGREGEGYRIARAALGEGRISIAAACTGIAQSALEQAVDYVRRRSTFGEPVADRQGIRFMLAEMARDVAAARALVREAAAARDRQEPVMVAAGLAKWTASDTALRVATDAVQLFGANGYSREAGIERLMRDAKGAQIYEGTNQIQRLIVADALLPRGTG